VAIGINVCEDRDEKLWFLLLRRQHPAERLAEELHPIDEWCVCPVLFRESLNDFSLTDTTS
jgi:hypothetical protein